MEYKKGWNRNSCFNLFFFKVLFVACFKDFKEFIR